MRLNTPLTQLWPLTPAACPLDVVRGLTRNLRDHPLPEIPKIFTTVRASLSMSAGLVYCGFIIRASSSHHLKCQSLQCTPPQSAQSIKTVNDPITKSPTNLIIFLRFFSSALSFWAEVRLSASARLSTAMARKTFRRMTVILWSGKR